MNTKGILKIVKARAVFPSLFYFIGIFIFAQTANAEKINPIVHAAYKDVLNFDFNIARDKLKFISNDPVNNPYSIYVANLCDVLEIYVSDSELLFDQYKSLENSRLKQVERLSDDKPEKYFLEAEIKIQWAFAKFKFGHYLKAFWGFRQAYSIAQEGHELFPDFMPLNKSLGVLHTVLGSFPDNYNWLLSMMNAEGDISLGMTELNKFTPENSIFWAESNAYKTLFQSFLLNEKKEALANTEIIINKNNVPNVMKVVGILVYFKTTNSQKAEQLLLSLEKSDEYASIPFLLYISGEINLQKGDYTNAIQYYLNFIHNSKGINYIKDAHVKIAICHWLKNNSNYKLYLSKARTEGLAEIDADKNAEQLAKSETLPDKNLLKMRYATDGGYFREMEKLLQQVNEKNFESDVEILEYHYRLARYYHLTEKINLAQREYGWVIRHQIDPELYFAPNSCLQTGYILVVKKEYKMAETYFNNALSYKNHPYKYSIDKKAEIELQNIQPFLQN